MAHRVVADLRFGCGPSREMRTHTGRNKCINGRTRADADTDSDANVEADAGRSRGIGKGNVGLYISNVV